MLNYAIFMKENRHENGVEMTPELVPIFIELYFTKMSIITIISVYHWRVFSSSLYTIIPHPCSGIPALISPKGILKCNKGPELARALIAIIKRACEFDYCLNRTTRVWY